MYDSQQIELHAETTSDIIWINFQYNRAFEADPSAFLQAGEEITSWQKAQFILQWCGDDNNCFQTTTIDTREVDYSDIDNQIREWRKTECEQSGIWYDLAKI